ncbi:hypothetical protein CIK04_25940 [Vibrio sp. 03_296]|nr:hypothetical protein [Vibrio sp. 03_296]OZT82301.1 hypothetical protein CIK04_25940 [Vibrio sp. 03_296]
MFDQKMVSTSLTIKRGPEYTYLWRSYLPGYNILTFMSENLSNLICDINSKEKYFIFDGMKKIMTDMKSILSATFMGL